MSKRELLNRDAFRNAVFQRDGHRCVICDQPAVDAHHIIERRLFPDGGYYLGNGASLCEAHHLTAEMTTLSVEEIREACGIKDAAKVVPPHLYPDQVYDKWGNTVLSNGTRTRGELFNDPSVQKVLASGDVLNLFTYWVKYPRTFHLPFSPGVGKDDRVLASCEVFEGKNVVATVKMDGENTTMYQDYIHARSLSRRRHVSRSWVQNFHAGIAFDIPVGWRICGENLWAEHSIPYHNLKSYFYGFSVWDNDNNCLAWPETLEWFALLGITPVPILYEGIWDEAVIRDLYSPTYGGCKCEGFVVRLVDGFAYGEFQRSVAKYVREDHVTKHNFWMSEIKQNKLA